MGFSRKVYWSGLPFPSPVDFPNPGIKPASPVSAALAGWVFTTEPPGKPTGVSTLPNLSRASGVCGGETLPCWSQLFYMNCPQPQHIHCGCHTFKTLFYQFPSLVPTCSITCFLESKSKHSHSENQYMCLKLGSLLFNC